MNREKKEQITTMKKRNYGIDALRLVAMYLVVILHIMGQGGVLSASEGFTTHVSWMFEVAAFCAVNCFALVSGYVGFTEEERPYRYSRYISVWLQVAFYSVGITLFTMVWKPELVESGTLAKMMQPVATNQYWYFTAYTGLFFVIPWLNIFVRRCTERELNQLMGVILIVFSGYSIMVSGVSDPFKLGSGYSFLWLVILYIIGAWMKKCSIPEKVSIKHSMIGIAVCVMLTWMGVIYRIFGDYSMLSYVSPTMLGMSVFMVIAFAKAEIGEKGRKVIGTFAPAAFGVYLIHVHGIVWNNWMKGRFASIAEAPLWQVPLRILGCAAVVFILCLLIEKGRLLLFQVLRIDQGVEIAVEWLWGQVKTAVQSRKPGAGGDGVENTVGNEQDKKTGTKLKERERKPKDKKRNKRILKWDRPAILVCLITAIGIITVCSKSSFLYPLNDWVDSNCFFTVGKSMMNGLVVYRDLLEQKGPFLYFLHGIAWLISHDTFFGVYLIEIVAAFFFLYFSYQTVRVLCEKASLVVVPLMALLVYTTNAFSHGDSAEELCFPFLAYAIWICVKALKEQKDISLKQYFIIGVTSGCVFWTKFTMVGFYIGWFIVPAVLLMKEKRWKQLGQAIVAIAAGVFVATLPYLIYFGMNGAIDNWIDVYIIDNIFTYNTNTGATAATDMIASIDSGLKTACRHNLPAMFLSVVGAVMLLFKKERVIGTHLVISLLATLIFTYLGGRNIIYYSFIFSIFVPYGIGVISKAVAFFLPELNAILHEKLMIYLLVFLGIGAAVLQTPNGYLMGVDKSELPQYQFKEIIEQVEDPTLLNYGFLDGGFYTVCNIIPNCKAFCQLNIPLTEMYMMQDYYAQAGLCDFIVTRDEELEFEKYECVAKSSYVFEGYEFEYYLYQLK